MDLQPAFSALPAPLALALAERGFTELTVVQQAVSEAAVEGRDLRVSSRTGSGKTVALGIVLGRTLAEDASPRPYGAAQPRALLIAPTRELAAQIGRELDWLFAGRELRVSVVTGGTSVGLERRELSANPAIVVGTPGRLCDHVSSGALVLSRAEAVVLDEADQMLDLGFREALEMLLGAVPEGCRRHLVSATFPRGVEALASRCQQDPLVIEGSAPGEAHADILYLAHLVPAPERYAALVNVLLAAPDERTLVFVRTRADVATLSTRLSRDGFRAAALSGEMAQNERTRTLEAFRAGAVTLLVCTDVASRGLDIPDVQRVIHGELPDAPEVLTHRSGRTGRAGNKGTSVLLVPERRRAFAEMLLRGARVRARFCAPPTPEEIAAAAEERAFARLSSLAQEHDPARHAALVERLLEEVDARALVGALLSQLGVDGPTAAHTLSVVSPKAPARWEPKRPGQVKRSQGFAGGRVPRAQGERRHARR